MRRGNAPALFFAVYGYEMVKTFVNLQQKIFKPEKLCYNAIYQYPAAGKEGSGVPAFDAVLFDVDGTLLHSRPGILHTFAYAFRRMGLDPAGIDCTRYLGPPLRWSFAQHFSGEAEIERAVELYRTRYAAVGMHECAPFPGVVPMLEQLRAAGVFLATATCKPVDVLRPILAEQGLAGYFDLIGGASLDKSVDTKADVIRRDLADARLGGKRILMVGDRQDDLLGAAACGLPAAGVLYGYGPRAELEACGPQFLAADCAELTRFILGGGQNAIS